MYTVGADFVNLGDFLVVADKEISVLVSYGGLTTLGGPGKSVLDVLDVDQEGDLIVCAHFAFKREDEIFTNVFALLGAQA